MHGCKIARPCWRLFLITVSLRPFFASQWGWQTRYINYLFVASHRRHKAGDRNNPAQANRRVEENENRQGAEYQTNKSIRALCEGAGIRRRKMTRQTKQTIKQTALVISLFVALLSIFIIDGARKDRMMDAYAKENNCTWYATGTWYGDDRDFICK